MLERISTDGDSVDRRADSIGWGHLPTVNDPSPYHRRLPGDLVVGGLEAADRGQYAADTGHSLAGRSHTSAVGGRTGGLSTRHRRKTGQYSQYAFNSTVDSRAWLQ